VETVFHDQLGAWVERKNGPEPSRMWRRFRGCDR
jgi:hypothetical protein